jgi:GDP-L-fucose synthase
MNKHSRIFVAGGKGLVGSAIVEQLSRMGFVNVEYPNRTSVDLERNEDVRRYFEETRPEYVFICAAKVGGVLANSRYPVEFMNANLRIQMNLLNACHEFGVKKTLFLASSCVYPRESNQPIKEESLMTGLLDQAHSSYAIAKIAGMEMCTAFRREFGENFVSVVPTNVFGPRDHFYDLVNSHVVPALITKFHVAKEKGEPVEIWGTGSSMRDLLYSEDLAKACILIMEEYDSAEPINVGSGRDVTILELADEISGVVGFQGELRFDSSKPEGTPRRLLDITKLRSMGWSPESTLRQSLEMTYRWFLDHALRA